MDNFGLNVANLPDRFYRVTYPNSTPFSETTGFEARNQSLVNLESPDRLREAIKYAFTWSSRVPSPFIAVFSERDHAERWAISYHRRHQGNVAVVEIDTSKLTNVKVLRLSTVVQALGIILGDGAAQHELGAYLCLKAIPPRAIMSVTPVSELLSERESRSKPRNRVICSTIPLRTRSASI
jgi:hypothetical protein